MNKIIVGIAACLASGLFITGTTWGAPLRVLTTTEDLAAITREVGGSLVEVESLTRGAQNPHYLDARPSLILKASRADLLILIGMELESGWVPSLLVGARNRNIQPGSTGYLDLSSEIEPLDVPVTVDRSQGDVHPSGNPHYWLDPENGKIMARVIGQRLIELIPSETDTIRRRVDSFHRRLDEALSGWLSRMQPFFGRKIVTYHNSWAYFVRRFRLQVVGHMEPKPGIPPSPAHLNSLITNMKREDVRVVLMEPYFSPAIPELLSRETGAQVLTLPPSVGGQEGIKTYVDLFDHLTEQLASAFGKGT